MNFLYGDTGRNLYRYREPINSDIELLTKLIESLEIIISQMIQRTYRIINNLIKRAHLYIKVQGEHFEHLLLYYFCYFILCYLV